MERLFAPMPGSASSRRSLCKLIKIKKIIIKIQDAIPHPSKMEQFKVHKVFDKLILIFSRQIGAKLEATDQCESNLVCPATITAIRGRLLQIHFDGWGDDLDQLFDYRLVKKHLKIYFLI